MTDAWYLLPAEVGSPAGNMAVDAVLLSHAAITGRPVLRFYSWAEPAATFGYSQHYAEVSTWTRLRPLIRRPTGGGLVPHDADWTYSVAVPPAHPWYHLSAVESYQRMHEWLRRAFAHAGLTTELAPCCNPAGPGQCFIGAEKFDLLLGIRKLAGAAQRRNRQGLLIQGSIQPPPPGLERSAWESAMTTVGYGIPSHFEPWTLPADYRHAADQLAAEQFATAAHNQRR